MSFVYELIAKAQPTRVEVMHYNFDTCYTGSVEEIPSGISSSRFREAYMNPDGFLQIRLWD